MSKLRVLSLFIGALALIFAGVGVQTAYAAPTDLIISEYIEGSSNNKAIEIYNGTGVAINLTSNNYVVATYHNGAGVLATPTTSINLSGTIANGDVFVLATSTANATILGQTDQTTTVGWFNGDDVVILWKGGVGGTIIDSIGLLGNDPGTEWGTGLTSTADNTLQRIATICAGDTNPSDTFNPATEWNGFATDTFTGLGAHTVTCDTAPSVTTTTPTNSATNVLVGSTITINFSEAVDISAGGITVECPVATSITFTPALPATNVTNLVLTPSASLPYNTICTVTVFAANVADRDGTANNMVSNYVFSFTTESVTDTAPTVTTTTPTNGATGVLITSTITINFSEAVDVSAGGVTVECPVSTSVTLSPALPVSNTSSLVLTPSASLPYGTICTVTVLSGNVTDVDVNDPPNTMTADYVFSFTTENAPVITRIHDVQGNGSATPIPGSTVTINAIVVGDYQGPAATELRGFFVQEEDADADANPATSEGLFIFCSSCPTAVNVGDRVQITGTVSEFFNMTQITASTAGSITVISSGNPLPTPATITLPVPNTFATVNDYYEQFEGMLVNFPMTLTVSEYFELARYGQIILYEGGRPYQFTHNNAPSVAGYNAHLDNLARREVILDDINNTQNAPLGTTERIYHPQPGGLSIGTQGVNYFRGGDTVSNLTGILHWSFAGLSGTDAWRIRPVPNFPITFTTVNTRPSAPTVTGDVVVASFNVLNYFTTIDTTSSSNNGPCGFSGTMDCRGADSNNEFTQQTNKLVTALSGINADIFGLLEIQNTSDSATVAAIVTALNSAVGVGTYDYINTGWVGTDAITPAIIYKPAIVQPVGGFVIDTDAIHDRPPLAVLFEVVEVGNQSFGEQFYVIVNHFKSKGSSAGLPGDADAGDGQGQSNATRVLQATRLLTWISTTLTTDTDVLIIGDLNSNKSEDPITTLKGGGFTDLVEAFGGANAYSYVFDGQLGYLDHALANASLLPYITDTTDWHINADEIPLFDYNDTTPDTGEQSFERKPTANPLYEVNPYRTSDHDPVIIGISFPQPAPIVSSVINVGTGSLASTNPVSPVVITNTVGTVDITFSMDVQYGSAGADDADNLDNYIVLAEGSVAGFQTTGTTACVTGVNAGDTEIIPTGIAYNNATRTTTLTFSPVLGVGKYSVIVCGSTSIVNLFGIALNNGADVQYYFDIVINNNGGGNNGGGNTNTGGTTTTILTQQQIESGAVTGLPATGETPVWADNLRTGLAIGGVILLALGLGLFFFRRKTSTR